MYSFISFLLLNNCYLIEPRNVPLYSCVKYTWHVYSLSVNKFYANVGLYKSKIRNLEIKLNELIVNLETVEKK